MAADDKKIIFSMVGVSKAFTPNKNVLKDIYLSFFYGAKIGIIGLNGSGKSTLLKIIGLRPGEKLYEELLMDSERDKMTRTAHKKIFVANVDKIDDAQYDHMMQVLQSVEDKNDERAVEAIAEIVPTYHPDEKNRPDNKVELAEKDEKQAAG